MLNIIWVVLLAVGILCGIATGRTEEIGTALTESAGDAVTFGLGLIGICAFWCGMIRILEEAGGMAILQRLLRPLISAIFPSAKSDPEAQKQILTNITADFLGLGTGATPSGIAAVRRLSVLNGDQPTASREICLFLVLNSAALQLLPTTVIAMRAQAGSVAATDIILPTWLTSLASLGVALLCFRLLQGGRRGERRGTQRGERREARRGARADQKVFFHISNMEENDPRGGCA